ncbi:MAG: hypothetical protein ACLPVW_01345 [Terriglobales bacterium]
MTGSLDENDLGYYTNTSGAFTGYYVPDTTSDGRGSISASATSLLTGVTLQYYVVNSSTVLFIDVDTAAVNGVGSQVAVGTFEEQSSTSNAALAQSHIAIIRPALRPHAAFRRK